MRNTDLIEKQTIYKLSYVCGNLATSLKSGNLATSLKLNNLYFCYFLSHNHWVVVPDLLLAHGVVVEGAVVLIAISMNGAEEISTSAGEACEPKLFLTAQATVFLGLLSRNRLIFFFFSICRG